METRKIDTTKSVMLLVVKPGFIDKVDEIVKEFTSESKKHRKWELVAQATKTLTLEEALELYKINDCCTWYADCCDYMSSGPSTALLFTNDEDYVESTFWESKEIVCDFRLKWHDNTWEYRKNGLHSADSMEELKMQIPVYFDDVELI